MTLVQVLQKLRDDLMNWGITNFEAVNEGYNSLNSRLESLQGNSSTSMADLEKRVSTNEDNIEQIQDQIEYIDGTDDSALFIIDKNNNVVAYFDANGLHTTTVDAKGDILTEGNATIDGSLEVITDMSVSGNASIYGEVEIGSDLAVEGVLSVSEGIAQDGEAFYIIDQASNVIAYFNENGFFTTNIDVKDSIVAGGDLTIGGNSAISGSETVGEDLTVTNETTTKNLTVSAIANIQEGNIYNDLSVGGQIAAVGNISTDSDLTAEGDVRVKNFESTDSEKFFIIDSANNVVAYIDESGIHTTNLSTSLDLIVNGNATISGATGLTVANTTTTKDLNVTDTATVSENLNTKNLSVSGIANIQDLNIYNDLSVTGQIVAEGNITTNSDLEALGVFKSANLDATDSNAFFIIDAKENVVAYIDQAGIHTTNLFAKLSLEVTEGATINGDAGLTVSKTVKTNDLTVDNNATIAQELTTKNLNVIGIANIQDANIYNDLSVNGQAVVAGNISTESDVIAAGDIKAKNFSSVDSSSFYIIDSANNVIAYFNTNGLYTVDITTKGIRYDSSTDTYYTDTTNNSKNYSVNTTLVELLNNIINHNNRLKVIEARLEVVSNVMDFIGAFNTYNDLLAYASPDPGDVAVVIDTQKEFVYSNGSWVEFGYSTETAAAISNLQEVTGHTGPLEDGELDHCTRLTNLENNLAAEIDDRTNAIRAINYIGDYENSSSITSPSIGDIAVIGGYLKRYDGTAWQDFNGLSQKLYYINGEASDKVYFVDASNNAICYIDESGLHTTNIYGTTDLTIGGQTYLTGDVTMGNNLIVTNNMTSASVITTDITTTNLITNTVSNNIESIMYFDIEGTVSIEI